MPEATLSSKNQIVLPREAREALNVKPGDKIIVTIVGGKVLVLEKPQSYHKAILGRGSFPKGYLKKERASWR